MPHKEKEIERSGLFIVSFQLEGLCSALRLAVQTGQPHGKETIAILKKLNQDVSTVILRGKILERMPAIPDEACTVDLLAIAEILRHSLMVFLTPVELEEQQSSFGFRSRKAP